MKRTTAALEAPPKRLRTADNPNLPLDLWPLVGKHLDVRDMISMRTVCQAWFAAGELLQDHVSYARYQYARNNRVSFHYPALPHNGEPRYGVTRKGVAPELTQRFAMHTRSPWIMARMFRRRYREYATIRQLHILAKQCARAGMAAAMRILFRDYPRLRQKPFVLGYKSDNADIMLMVAKYI